VPALKYALKALLCGAVWVGCAAAPAGASAADETFAFSIPAKPLSEGLVDLAVRANLSIGADAAKACRPTGNAVVGRLTAEQGLARLLAGTGCGYRMIDARTVRIVRARFRPRQVPAPRVAENPAEPPVATVSEIVVTSVKRSVGLDRAPYAVSAVQGATLSESGAVNTADLAHRIAGLTVTNLGPGRNKLFVRGMSDGPLTGRTQATVGLYFDDSRTTYNAPDPDLRLVDVARIELLRGPQGSLYGAGSIGGVLQVITNPPSHERRSAWVSGAAETSSSGSPGGVIEGGFNLPLGDSIALRAVGYHEAIGGSINDAGLGLSDVDTTIRQGMRLSALWEISPRWTLGAGAIAQTLHTDDTHYADASLPTRSRSLYLQEPHRNDFDEAHLRLAGDFGWGTLKITGAAQTHEINSRYDATLARPQFNAAGGVPSPFDEESLTEAVVSEITLASPTGRRIEWLAGVFSSEFAQTTTSQLSNGLGGPSLYREVREDDIDESAAYGEVTWRIWRNLSLTAGGRYFELAVETQSTVAEPNGGSASFAGRRTEHGFAPKVLIRYEPSERMLFYAQVAEGYRAGGFNTGGRVGQAFPVAGQGPQPLRPFTGDELTNLEVGARFTFLDGRLRMRAALFQAHWENIQTDQLLPSGLPFTANIGDGHNRGLEVEAVYRRGGLRLDGNLLVSDPELDRAAPEFLGLADVGLPGVPRLLAGAAARYEWGGDEGAGRFVSLEASYVGSSTLAFDAAVQPKMGDYWTTRLAGGLVGDRWRITVYAENLLNSAGDTFAYGNPFSVRLVDQETPQRPPTLGVILTRDF